MSNTTLTQPFWTTPAYWALVACFAPISHLIFITEGAVIGGWVALLFAVILLPAAFIEAV